MNETLIYTIGHSDHEMAVLLDLLRRHGIQVVVDPDSAPLVAGSEIDYIEGLMRSGFVISNPNAPQAEGGCACGGQCSCGGEH